MAKINGTNLTVLVNVGDGNGLQPVGYSQDCKLSVEKQTMNATTKDSAGWDEIIPSNGKWNISTSGLVEFLPSNSERNVKLLYDALNNGTLVGIRFGIGGMNISEATGDQRFTGNGYITKLEMSAKDKDLVTYSITIDGTAGLTRAQV